MNSNHTSSANNLISNFNQSVQPLGAQQTSFISKIQLKIGLGLDWGVFGKIPNENIGCDTVRSVSMKMNIQVLLFSYFK